MAFTDTLRVAVRITGSRYCRISSAAEITRETLRRILRGSVARPRKTTAILVLNAVVCEIDAAELELIRKMKELRRVRTMLVKSYEEEYESHE